jgi:purine-binding chemotaxis protein CheW
MTSLTNETSTEAVNSDLSGKFLSFFLSDEEYGIEILKVREIIGVTEITPLPKTPDYVRGVINLRGRIIPVVDLRCQFEMGSTERTDETCIIVVEVDRNGESEQFQMGCLVDRVSEVMNVSQEQIEDAPRFGNRIDSDFILGLGKTKEKVLILLDIDKVFEAHDLQELARNAKSST